MAAYELGKSGKKVMILEARERIGGRVWALPEELFGYHAQAGAEFVHGNAPITKSIANKAGATLIPMQGDRWSSINGTLSPNQELGRDWGLLHQKLKELHHDMPIVEFLEKYFADEKFADLRTSIIRMVEGYDAADPYRISTFTLRDEWLGGKEWIQYRIKEGYGVLLKFLESECKKYRTEIHLNTVVKTIEKNKNDVTVRTLNGDSYSAEKVIVTVPLPVLQSIKFSPDIPEKRKASEQMGFGNVIKILLRFKRQWWVNVAGKDLAAMNFIFSNERVPVWWTQYPDPVPLLTGWLAGPKTKRFIKSSHEDIIEASFVSLANMFSMQKESIKKELTYSGVYDWSTDQFAKGAYSYDTTESQSARNALVRPIGNAIFFAGEALYSGQDSATVEGALASGQEVARRMYPKMT